VDLLYNKLYNKSTTKSNKWSLSITTRRPTARTTAKIKLTLRPVKTAEQKTIRPIQQYGDWYTGSGR